MAITTTNSGTGGFLDSLARQTFLNNIALEIRFIIQNRTKEGIDVYGVPFKAYNEKYAAKRKRHGLPTYPPDLIFDEDTGMMKKIDHEVFNNNMSAEIFINSPQKEQLAVYHNIMGAGKRRVIREFWGLTDEENTKLFEQINEKLGELGVKAAAEDILQILKKLEAKSNE